MDYDKIIADWRKTVGDSTNANTYDKDLVRLIMSAKNQPVKNAMVQMDYAEVELRVLSSFIDSVGKDIIELDRQILCGIIDDQEWSTSLKEEVKALVNRPIDIITER